MTNHQTAQNCPGLSVITVRDFPKPATDTIELALTASCCDQTIVHHKPRLLNDNGACYISWDLAEWLEGQNMRQIRGAPSHPTTKRKIKRSHQTMKNRVLLEHYYLPDDIERHIEAVVDYCSELEVPREAEQLDTGLRLLWQG